MYAVTYLSQEKKTIDTGTLQLVVFSGSSQQELLCKTLDYDSFMAFVVDMINSRFQLIYFDLIFYPLWFYYQHHLYNFFFVCSLQQAIQRKFSKNSRRAVSPTYISIQSTSLQNVIELIYQAKRGIFQNWTKFRIHACNSIHPHLICAPKVNSKHWTRYPDCTYKPLHCTLFPCNQNLCQSTMASNFSLSAIFLVIFFCTHSTRAQLNPDFYNDVCPKALPAIRMVVEAAVAQEPRMGASLLRLHFHDCFVNVRF